MKKPDQNDLSQLSMLELFRVETENQTAILTSSLLELERSPAPAAQLESLMRAAHSLKGAARIVNLPASVRVAHAMEDCFVAAQQSRLVLQPAHIDTLLRGVDLLVHITKYSEGNIASWESDHATEIETFLAEIAKLMPGVKSPPATSVPATTGKKTAPVKVRAGPAKSQPPETLKSTERARPFETTPSVPTRQAEVPDRVLRLTAENLNRLLGLAGESLVESRWLRPFSESMQRLKRMQSDCERKFEDLRLAIESEGLSESLRARVNEVFRHAAESRLYLDERLQELDRFDRRSAHLSNRLYLEVLRTRMRPFGDGTRRFPRMVRDLARSLGKQARLEIIGEDTQVDRDILDRLEAPLAHLLRNAVDHGCEPPEVRVRAGKAAEGCVRLEARHSAGMLVVGVSDDGAGLAVEDLRRMVVDRQLTTAALAERMSEQELLQFLFLPGFSLREAVTEISGRGVGLDVVQNMVKGVRGSVRVFNRPGQGLAFQLHLPLTLSVLRALLVEVGGEPYAFPLAQIAEALRLPRERVQVLEGRHYFSRPGAGRGAPASECISLVAANRVLGVNEDGRMKNDESRPAASPSSFSVLHSSLAGLPVVVLGDHNSRYGLWVDGFLGERELVVQPLDPRLGKVRDVSAAALMEDGSPVLIVDVDEVLGSLAEWVAAGVLGVDEEGRMKNRETGPATSPSSFSILPSAFPPTVPRRKRILVVDDSLTVRELERKLLENRGYLADVAVDGVEGWNAVRTGLGTVTEGAFRPEYDLVITDVDMPRMDGIELARLIKGDARLKSLPVMIVSYKDREEDRMRGLEAGADFYLTKGSFQDEALLEAVLDLIGEPEGG